MGVRERKWKQNESTIVAHLVVAADERKEVSKKGGEGRKKSTREWKSDGDCILNYF